MPQWTFYCLDGKAEDDNLWHKWWQKDADDRAKGNHEARFKYLETWPFKEWPPKWFKQLGNGLIEIKIKGDVEWRLMGFVRGEYEFVFVLTCYHKDKRYYPNQKAIQMARDKIEIVRKQPKRAIKSVRPSEASQGPKG